MWKIFGEIGRSDLVLLEGDLEWKGACADGVLKVWRLCKASYRDDRKTESALHFLEQ